MTAADFLAGNQGILGEFLEAIEGPASAHDLKHNWLQHPIVGKVLAGASLTEVLVNLWRADPALSKQQKGAIQDFSYGVLRFYGQLEAILNALLTKPLHDKCLTRLLLVSLYQLLYSKTQPHVIV
jgi:hypothetical protein